MIHSDGENLVFLFSLPRSGSTIFSLLLDSHTCVRCPAEPWFLLKLAHLLKPWTVNILVDDELARIGTNDFLGEERFRLAANAFATAAYNHYLEKSGKKIFVDKTPRYYHILPFIDSLFPKARKIWLKRNPLDVAHSFVESWGICVDMLVGDIFRTVSLDFSMGLFNLASYFFERSPYRYTLKYEELMRTPRDTLGGVCDFLKIPYEDNMLDYARNTQSLTDHKTATLGDRKAVKTQRLHAKSVGKWKNGLSKADLTKLAHLLGRDIFSRMGYDDTLQDLDAIGIRFCDEHEALLKREAVSKQCSAAISSMETQLFYLHNAFRPKFVNQKIVQSKSMWFTKLRNLFE